MGESIQLSVGVDINTADPEETEPESVDERDESEGQYEDYSDDISVC